MDFLTRNSLGGRPGGSLSELIMRMANGVWRSLQKSEKGKLEIRASGAVPEQGAGVEPTVWVGVGVGGQKQLGQGPQRSA